VPNCATGWGEIDARAAVKAAQEYTYGEYDYLPWITKGWAE
jgi:hypothetical protein